MQLHYARPRHRVARYLDGRLSPALLLPVVSAQRHFLAGREPEARWN